MARDLDVLSDVVVMTVKAAQAPLLERIAGLEAKLAAMAGVERELNGLRERVVVAETKAQNMTPVVSIPDVESRLTSLELKALPPELTGAVEDVKRRLDAMVAPLTVDDIKGMIREQFEAIAAATDKTLEQNMSSLMAAMDKSERSVADLSKDLGALRERVAVAEVKTGAPGPQGPAGADGKDGHDGKDGADGMGFDDMTVEQGTDERTLIVKAVRGERVKELGRVTLPAEIYRGVYAKGQTYERGDGVTWGGSEWHCNETTSSVPGESKSWTLKVKRGRDGKDGKDAVTLPVVSVGGARG